MKERMEFEFCLADLEREHVIAYGDASGKERLIGVVVFSGEERYFTTWEVPQKLWNMLVSRRIHQIKHSGAYRLGGVGGNFRRGS